jgi:predicted neuraminidase
VANPCVTIRVLFPIAVARCSQLAFTSSVRFGGSAEGARDVSIMSASRLSASGVWSTPRRIARVLEGFESHWNPVLFFNADRSKLYLHFKASPRL